MATYDKIIAAENKQYFDQLDKISKTDEKRLEIAKAHFKKVIITQINNGYNKNNPDKKVVFDSWGALFETAKSGWPDFIASVEKYSYPHKLKDFLNSKVVKDAFRSHGTEKLKIQLDDKHDLAIDMYLKKMGEDLYAAMDTSIKAHALLKPTPLPTSAPTHLRGGIEPTSKPSVEYTDDSTDALTAMTTDAPSVMPTLAPSNAALTDAPTVMPTLAPSSAALTDAPTFAPTFAELTYTPTVELMGNSSSIHTDDTHSGGTGL